MMPLPSNWLGLDMYVHRPDLKYEHQVWLGSKHYPSIGTELDEMFEWCKEHFGNYGDQWMGPPTNYRAFYVNERFDDKGYRIAGELMYVPHRFKELEDAMAFELRWS